MSISIFSTHTLKPVTPRAMPTPTFRPIPTTDEFEEVLVFVPIDPRVEPEDESAFLELFGSALASACLGIAGLEILGHAVECAAHYGEARDAARPQVSPLAVAQAVQAWRVSGQSFSPGQVPGVWVPARIPRSRLKAWMRTYDIKPAPSSNWRDGAVIVPVGRAARPCTGLPRPQYRPRWL